MHQRLLPNSPLPYRPPALSLPRLSHKAVVHCLNTKVALSWQIAQVAMWWGLNKGVRWGLKRGLKWGLMKGFNKGLNKGLKLMNTATVIQLLCLGAESH